MLNREEHNPMFQGWRSGPLKQSSVRSGMFVGISSHGAQAPLGAACVHTILAHTYMALLAELPNSSSGGRFYKPAAPIGAIAPVRSIILLLALLALLPACSPKTEAPAEKPAEKSAEPESLVQHGTNGEVLIKLEAAKQKAMGLETAALAPAQLPPELQAYGRVLDVSPLASLVADLNTAQAARQVSEAELQRLKTLSAQNNASQRALQTAEAAAVRDQTQVESIRLRLVAAWGSAIAERQDLPGFVQALASLNSALVELNVPAGEPISSQPLGAQLQTLAAETKAVPAQFLSLAPLIDPQMQGRSFLFLVNSNSQHLTPGTAVSGFLSLPGAPQTGVLLPRSAIVRFNGTTWVYQQTGEEIFQRVETRLVQPLDDGWFVREGLKPQDKVVTVGAQELLSEELKGQTGD